MTTDTRKKEERKKVAIFLDSENNGIGVLELFKVGLYCKKNNWDVISITNNYPMDSAFSYGLFLSDIKKYKYIRKITVIIVKDTCEAPENLISCAIFGALEMLDIIEVQVLEYNSQIKDKSKRIKINPYSKLNKIDLMNQAVISLENITKKINN